MTDPPARLCEFRSQSDRLARHSKQNEMQRARDLIPGQNAAAVVALYGRAMVPAKADMVAISKL